MVIGVKLYSILGLGLRHRALVTQPLVHVVCTT